MLYWLETGIEAAYLRTGVPSITEPGMLMDSESVGRVSYNVNLYSEIIHRRAHQVSTILIERFRVLRLPLLVQAARISLPQPHDQVLAESIRSLSSIKYTHLEGSIFKSEYTVTVSDAI